MCVPDTDLLENVIILKYYHERSYAFKRIQLLSTTNERILTDLAVFLKLFFKDNANFTAINNGKRNLVLASCESRTGIRIRIIYILYIFWVYMYMYNCLFQKCIHLCNMYCLTLTQLCIIML